MVKPAETDLLSRVEPLRLERAPTIADLRNVVRVARQRWRNDGLTAGRHAGSPVRLARPRRVLAARGNAPSRPRVRRQK